MKGLLKGIDLKKLGRPALFGLAAFIGSIIAVQKVPLLDDQKKLKKILLPLVIGFILLKVAKKKEAQIAVLAGILPILGKAAAEYTGNESLTALIPVELGNVYELPITDPRAQALLNIVQPQPQTVQGEIMPPAFTPTVQVEVSGDEDFILRGDEDFVLSADGYDAGTAAHY
ncbi:MAG: hypothetical protein F9K24_20730 [Leptonema illini]|uniref:Uncharacterized protein n=1 Tax=Leptonema illini TaxID=183 RepID=A0A833GXF7_9LEPT|nr:MAG: hypothetical protein F9K24_20730 [Leptonema illini]